MQSHPCPFTHAAAAVCSKRRAFFPTFSCSQSAAVAVRLSTPMSSQTTAPKPMPSPFSTHGDASKP